MAKGKNNANKYALGLGLGVFALGLGLEFFGKDKVKTTTEVLNFEDNLKKKYPNYSSGINHKATASLLHSQMDGINWVTTPDYELIYDLPKDDDVRILYNMFNYMFEPAGTDTLTTWVDDESENWIGGKEKALKRLRGLGLL